MVQSDLEIPDPLWEENPDEGNAEDGSVSVGIAACCCENGWRRSLLAKPSDFVGISWRCASRSQTIAVNGIIVGILSSRFSNWVFRSAGVVANYWEAPSLPLCAACGLMGIAWWEFFAGTVEERPCWGWDLSSDRVSTHQHLRRRRRWVGG